MLGSIHTVGSRYETNWAQNTQWALDMKQTRRYINYTLGSIQKLDPTLLKKAAKIEMSMKICWQGGGKTKYWWHFDFFLSVCVDQLRYTLHIGLFRFGWFGSVFVDLYGSGSSLISKFGSGYKGQILNQKKIDLKGQCYKIFSPHSTPHPLLTTRCQ